MSLASNFAHSRHPGFTRSVDPHSARRQLHMSIGVAAVLAVAIGGSAMAVRPLTAYDAQSQRASVASAFAVQHHNLDAGLHTGLSNGG